jgi:hypothetical protein
MRYDTTAFGRIDGAGQRTFVAHPARSKRRMSAAERSI